MTPTEKDAMALATLAACEAYIDTTDSFHDRPGEGSPVAEHRKARAHLASRIAELEKMVVDYEKDYPPAVRALRESTERATRAEAELAAVREDAERYRFLRDMKCNHFHLTLNADHAVNYMTARQWIEEGPDWYAENTPEEREAMAAAGTIWCLQVYPDTPNGFYVWNRATLDAAVDAARGGE